MSSVQRELVAAFLAGALFLAAGAARAEEEIPGYPALHEYDAREVAMLPRFCPYTTLFNEKVPGGNNVAERNRWQAVFGDTFRHLHHFCWGLMKTNRAVLLARNDRARRFYLGDANHEFDYVIERSPEDFVLLPEILARKGQNQIRLGQGPRAIQTLERAAQLKPDYWPPYAYLADYFAEIGEVGKAREYLERGLAVKPDSNPLKTRLEELEKRKAAPAKRSPPAAP